MKNYIKSFIFGMFSTVLIMTLVYSFLGKNGIKKAYWLIHSFFQKTLTQQSINSEKFKECLPKIISQIPYESSVVIGHAYGRGGTALIRNTLSPKVENFLELNKDRINTLFLTGDVFNVPSLSRWRNLYDKYEDYFDIYISPGNHDIDTPLKKDLFKLFIGQKQNINFPFLIKKQDFTIVIDDSNSKEKNIFNSNKFLKNLNQVEEDLIFLRHHVLIDKLSDLGGKTINTYNEKFFEKKFKLKNKIFFIYGNGGMYQDTPRIACYAHKNITHLLNGIGEFKNDNVLVIKNKSVYRYILSR